jgi:hypothetical protein
MYKIGNPILIEKKAPLVKIFLIKERKYTFG